MIRPIAVITILISLFVALQNCTECLVMAQLACPFEMDICQPEPCGAMVSKCADRTESKSTSCCSSAEPPAQQVNESGCGSSCRDMEPKPFCPTPAQRAKCCLVVHPFWIEPPAKLTIIPPNSSGFLPEPRIQISESKATEFVQEHIPPWGIHPTISTTVLRI